MALPGRLCGLGQALEMKAKGRFFSFLIQTASLPCYTQKAVRIVSKLRALDKAGI